MTVFTTATIGPSAPGHWQDFIAASLTMVTDLAKRQVMYELPDSTESKKPGT